MILRNSLVRTARFSCSHVAPLMTGAAFAVYRQPCHISTFSTTVRHNKRISAKRTKAHATPDDEPARHDALLQRFREALETSDAEAVMFCYGQLPSSMAWDHRDVADMARCVEYNLKLMKSADRVRRGEGLIMFLQTLVYDIQSGKLPPSPSANSILLGLFQLLGLADDGVSFWTWLGNQNIEYLDQAVYANAIDLVVDQGKDLQVIEAIYQDFLKKFPGTYLEYHLSPNAIATDGITSMQNIPRRLLKSMARARLSRGSTREAYLTLDTLLRLSANELNAAFFEDFIKRRPLPEAFQLLSMACRYSQTTRNDLLNDVLEKMRHISSADNHLYLVTTRAAIRLLYVFLASTHAPSSQNLALVVASVLRSASLPGFSSLTGATRIAVGDQILAAIKSLVRLFEGYGVKPNISAINHMLTAFGRDIGHESAVAYVLRLQADNLIDNAKNGITSSILVQASGHLCKPSLLQQAWTQLCEEKPGKLNQIDWSLFAGAALKCDDLDFFHTEVDRLGMADSRDEIIANATTRIRKDDRYRPDVAGPSAAELADAVTKVHSDVELMETLLKTNAKPLMPPSMVPSQLASPVQQEGTSSEAMRQFFDSVTTVASAPEIPTTSATDDEKDGSSTVSAAAATKTNTDARYHDWLTISELLAVAERYDAEVRSQQSPNRVKEIGKQRGHEFIWAGMTKHDLRGQKHFGLTDLWPVDKQGDHDVGVSLRRDPAVDAATVRRVRNLGDA